MRHRPSKNGSIVLMLVCLCIVLAGCVSMRPPATTQPTPEHVQRQIVEEFYVWRGGYLNALTAGIALHAAGELDAQKIRDLESWRGVFVATQVEPRARSARPYIDRDEWDRLTLEQESIEALWRDRLKPPPEP